MSLCPFSLSSIADFFVRIQVVLCADHDPCSAFQEGETFLQTEGEFVDVGGFQHASQFIADALELIVQRTGFQIVACCKAHTATAIDAVAIDRPYDMDELYPHGFCRGQIETAMRSFHRVEDARMYELLKDLRGEGLRRTGAIGDLL